MSPISYRLAMKSPFSPRDDKVDMADSQANNPLHGVTLEHVLNHLLARYGWVEMGKLIEIRCFNSDPSVKSSLKFLRKTPWARAKVEELYVRSIK